LQKLKEIVRGTEQFRSAEAQGKLLRLPTGDGGALVFRTSVEAPVLCALEISKEVKKHPELRVRMGIHSGPVNEITLNIAGSQVFHKVKSKDTDNVFSVVEIVTPQGKGVTHHVHEREDELVYLLEGEIEVTLGNQKMKAVPGVMALLPRGIPHSFTSVGNKPSRLLDTILPGQFDNYFVELAALFAAGDPSEGQIDGLSRKYRIKYLEGN
jgi:quercetin dioxygenase-like cupin family protein